MHIIIKNENQYIKFISKFIKFICLLESFYNAKLNVLTKKNCVIIQIVGSIKIEKLKTQQIKSITIRKNYELIKRQTNVKGKYRPTTNLMP